MKFLLGLLILHSFMSCFSCYSIPIIEKNANILGLLGQLTNGTSISNVFTLLNLLNNVHQLQGDVSALPNDIANAINHLSGVLNTTVSNLAGILSGSNLQSKSFHGKNIIFLVTMSLFNLVYLRII